MILKCFFKFTSVGKECNTTPVLKVVCVFWSLGRYHKLQTKLFLGEQTQSRGRAAATWRRRERPRAARQQEGWPLPDMRWRPDLVRIEQHLEFCLHSIDVSVHLQQRLNGIRKNEMNSGYFAHLKFFLTAPTYFY